MRTPPEPARPRLRLRQRGQRELSEELRLLSVSWGTQIKLPTIRPEATPRFRSDDTRTALCVFGGHEKAGDTGAKEKGRPDCSEAALISVSRNRLRQSCQRAL